MYCFQPRCFLTRLMLSAVGLLTLLTGCSKQEAVLGPAEGIVKINGQPAANIMVQFLPMVEEGAPAPTSSAVTDEYGEFEMTTDDGRQGAVVGKCKVLFIDTTEERPPQGVEVTKPPRISSTLTVISPRTQEVEVEEENPRFEFNLTN